MYQHVLNTIDTHTAGEPTRVVVSGVPFLEGTMMEKRRQLQDRYDFIRTMLMHEPRGHADMYGAIIMAPTHREADLGVVFMDSDGYHAMCGHGSIGVVTAALTSGIVPRQEPETVVLIDTPAGLVKVRAEIDRGQVGRISLENVPAFLYGRDLQLDLPWGPLQIDISFGGNFFVLVPAERLGITVTLSHLSDLIQQGMAILEAARTQMKVAHPTKPHIDTVDLVEIYEENPEEGVDCRNVVVFGKGQVDRSPCGTGTCAKMAALYAEGRLDLGEAFVNQSIIGTRFMGRLLREERVGDVAAVIPEIAGRAYVTGFQQFVVDSNDPLKSGFLLSDGSV